ncbi:MAG: putative 4-hydroxybenzoate polyprenyltransferase [Thermoleophilia bacterium]|nr:putative 4-hydroxybenzoate polyprenyltransferase [Thermoleophilia bacterium]
MATSSRAASPAAGLALVPALLGLVRFAHTVFALPFALAGALLAGMAWPPAATLGWIVLAMVGARSLAMALNRLVDARIDAMNPRTAGREIPAGRLTRGQVWAFSAASLAVLLLAVSRLPELTWYLWPIPVALFVLYPYAKRFTWACHLVLGVTIGIAPVGGWIAVTGELAAAPLLLGLGVACWIAGFDVIYALLDLDFDRANGIRSIPARFGPARALWITRALHLAAVALLAAGGAAAGAGWVYQLGVALCAAVLVYENLHVDPADQRRIQAAFGTANMVISLTYITFVILAVAAS